MKKEEKGWHEGRYRKLLCVEEPFTEIRNLGNSADDISVNGIREECRRAFAIIRDRADLSECCRQYIFPTHQHHHSPISASSAPGLTKVKASNNPTSETHQTMISQQVSTSVNAVIMTPVNSKDSTSSSIPVNAASLNGIPLVINSKKIIMNGGSPEPAYSIVRQSSVSINSIYTENSNTSATERKGINGTGILESGALNIEGSSSNNTALMTATYASSYPPPPGFSMENYRNRYGNAGTPNNGIGGGNSIVSSSSNGNLPPPGFVSPIMLNFQRRQSFANAIFRIAQTAQSSAGLARNSNTTTNDKKVESSPIITPAAFTDDHHVLLDRSIVAAASRFGLSEMSIPARSSSAGASLTGSRIPPSAHSAYMKSFSENTVGSGSESLVYSQLSNGTMNHHHQLSDVYEDDNRGIPTSSSNESGWIKQDSKELNGIIAPQPYNSYYFTSGGAQAEVSELTNEEGKLLYKTIA